MYSFPNIVHYECLLTIKPDSRALFRISGATRSRAERSQRTQRYKESARMDYICKGDP
jgi:hypothetical protein